MNLYEANQAIYQNAPSITDRDGAQAQIRNYLTTHPSKYYLMLNNDERYYTLYTFKNEFKFNKMAKEILDISLNLGDIKDIVTSDNGYLEFWIIYKEKPTMFILFDYTRGVIEI